MSIKLIGRKTSPTVQITLIRRDGRSFMQLMPRPAAETNLTRWVQIHFPMATRAMVPSLRIDLHID